VPAARSALAAGAGGTEPAAASGTTPATGPRTVAGPHAGAFLLLPALADLALPDDEHAGAARLLALAKCLGAGDALADPLLQLAAGLDEPPRELPRADDRAALDAVAERLVAGGHASGRRLRAELAAGRLVVSDLDGGEWLAVEPAAERLPAVLARIGAACGVDPEPVTAPEAGSPGTERELEYFAVAGLDPRLDATWTGVARAVLRRFARGLFGFEGSSAPYLRRNFLGAGGTVRVAAGEIAVELNAPPLALVLRLAGFDGSVYEPPWLTGRHVRISFR
jgi:hypothetical protein